MRASHTSMLWICLMAAAAVHRTASTPADCYDHTFDPNVSEHPNLKLLPRETCGYRQPKNSFTTGNFTELNEFRFMALLMRDNQTVCSGTLISERYVLTARHCVDDEESRPNTVRLGEYDILSDPDCQLALDEKSTYCTDRVQFFNISDAKISFVKGCEPDLIDKHDIALIRLPKAADMSFENVQPICLPWTEELQNAVPYDYYTAGWGHSSPVASATNELVQIRMPAMTAAECEAKLYVKVQPTEICAGGRAEEHSCFDVAGGPLFSVENDDRLKYVLFGVQSIIREACSRFEAERKTYTFTNVAKYMRWILDTIEE